MLARSAVDFRVGASAAGLTIDNGDVVDLAGALASERAKGEYFHSAGLARDGAECVARCADRDV